MDALQLVELLQEARPGCEPAEHLRMALLISLQNPSLADIHDPEKLDAMCQEIAMQMSATSDQHSAVADELDSLAATAPCDFSPDHLWTLIRAIKVQSQMLNLYLGPSQAK